MANCNYLSEKNRHKNDSNIITYGTYITSRIVIINIYLSAISLIIFFQILNLMILR